MSLVSIVSELCMYNGIKVWAAKDIK